MLRMSFAGEFFVGQIFTADVAIMALILLLFRHVSLFNFLFASFQSITFGEISMIPWFV
jgi:hypothetical protein